MRDETPQQIHWGLSIQDWSKLPRGAEWVRQRKPGFIVVRTRTVRLSDGSVEKFFVLRERPKNKIDLLALEKEIGILMRAARASRIAASDRVLLARKNFVNGDNPRRKKAKR